MFLRRKKDRAGYVKHRLAGLFDAYSNDGPFGVAMCTGC